MSESTEAYRVDPWRMSLLLETARKNPVGSYMVWFVKQWVRNVTANGPLPDTVEEWLEKTKGEEDGSRGI